MSLDGAKLICLNPDDSGEFVTIPAHGKTFKFGYYMNCDVVLEHPDSMGLQATIDCDAFGRVTIENRCPDHNITLDGKILKKMRPLLHNTEICLFDKKYLWHFEGNKQPKGYQMEDANDFTTPSKPITKAEQAPNSEPARRWCRQYQKRLTVHSFAYFIKPGESPQDIEIVRDENKPLNTHKPILSIDADSIAIKRLSPSPPPVADFIDLNTPKISQLSISGRTTPLNLCRLSETVITSYSPRETGIRPEKSFAIIQSPSLASPKKCAALPEINLSVFQHVPSPLTQNQRPSMHLIDLTTPIKRTFAVASPTRTLLKSTLKKNIPKGTPKQTSVSNTSLGSTESVYSVNSTDDESVIELSDDGSNLSSPVAKTPPRPRTPQSLMKRAILSSAKKAAITKRILQPEPPPANKLSTPKNAASTVAVRFQSQSTPQRKSMGRFGSNSSEKLSKTMMTSTPFRTSNSSLSNPRRSSILRSPSTMSTSLKKDSRTSLMLKQVLSKSATIGSATKRMSLSNTTNTPSKSQKKSRNSVSVSSRIQSEDIDESKKLNDTFSIPESETSLKDLEKSQNITEKVQEPSEEPENILKCDVGNSEYEEKTIFSTRTSFATQEDDCSHEDSKTDHLSTPLKATTKQNLDDDDFEGLDQFFKTPKARNVMILSSPKSVSLKKPTSDSVELVHSVEFDLSTNLDDIFKTPQSGFISNCTEVENTPRTDKKSSEIVSPEEAFDMLVGRPILRKSYAGITPRKKEQISPLKMTSDPDFPQTDIEEWIDKVNESAEINEESKDEDEMSFLTATMGETSKDPLMVSGLSSGLSSIKCKKLIKTPKDESAMTILEDDEDEDRENGSILKDPLEVTAPIPKRSMSPNISGIGLLDHTSESIFSETLAVSDESSLKDIEKTVEVVTDEQNETIKKDIQISPDRGRLEIEQAFANFEAERKIFDRKILSSTPEGPKPISKISNRRTLGNQVQFSNDFDLNALKAERDLEFAAKKEGMVTNEENILNSLEDQDELENILNLEADEEMRCAFEHFQEDPPFSEERLAQTPDGKKISTKESRRTLGNVLVQDITIDLQAAKDEREIEIAFENFEEEPKILTQRSVRTPEPVRTLKKDYRRTMGSGLVPEVELDIQAAKSVREMELAFENFEEEPGFLTDRAAKTPNPKKSSMKDQRRTLGTGLVTEVKFDLQAAKDEREMELAFENFREEPEFSKNRVVKTPEPKKSLHKDHRRTMGSALDSERKIDLQAAKAERELEIAFENFEEIPQFSNDRAVKTPQPNKSSLKDHRRTVGSALVSDLKFDIQAAKAERELKLAFENFKEEPEYCQSRSAITPEPKKSLIKDHRKTMGSNIDSELKLDLDAAKATRDMELAFENFEEEPEFSKDRVVKTPEAKKSSIKDHRRTMGSALASELHHDLQAAKSEREIELAFVNFQEEPDFSKDRAAKTPELKKHFTKDHRRTMGSALASEVRIDLQEAKAKREMELAFENFEETPDFTNNRAVKTPEPLKSNIKEHRRTLGNALMSETKFDLKAAKEEREMELAFENFVEEPEFCKDRTAKTPETKRSVLKDQRRTMGSAMVSQNQFDIQAAKAEREIELAFENFEEEPEFYKDRAAKTPEHQKSLIKDPRRTMGSTLVNEVTLDLKTAKAEREMEIAFANFNQDSAINSERVVKTPDLVKKSKAMRLSLGYRKDLDPSFNISALKPKESANKNNQDDLAPVFGNNDSEDKSLSVEEEKCLQLEAEEIYQQDSETISSDKEDTLEISDPKESLKVISTPLRSQRLRLKRNAQTPTESKKNRRTSVDLSNDIIETSAQRDKPFVEEEQFLATPCKKSKKPTEIEKGETTPLTRRRRRITDDANGSSQIDVKQNKIMVLEPKSCDENEPKLRTPVTRKKRRNTVDEDPLLDIKLSETDKDLPETLPTCITEQGTEDGVNDENGDAFKKINEMTPRRSRRNTTDGDNKKLKESHKKVLPLINEAAEDKLRQETKDNNIDSQLSEQSKKIENTDQILQNKNSTNVIEEVHIPVKSEEIPKEGIKECRKLKDQNSETSKEDIFLEDLDENTKNDLNEEVNSALTSQDELTEKMDREAKIDNDTAQFPEDHEHTKIIQASFETDTALLEQSLQEEIMKESISDVIQQVVVDDLIDEDQIYEISLEIDKADEEVPDEIVEEVKAIALLEQSLYEEQIEEPTAVEVKLTPNESVAEENKSNNMSSQMDYEIAPDETAAEHKVTVASEDMVPIDQPVAEREIVTEENTLVKQNAQKSNNEEQSSKPVSCLDSTDIDSTEDEVKNITKKLRTKKLKKKSSTKAVSAQIINEEHQVLEPIAEEDKKEMMDTVKQTRSDKEAEVDEIKTINGSLDLKISNQAIDDSQVHIVDKGKECNESEEAHINDDKNESIPSTPATTSTRARRRKVEPTPAVVLPLRRNRKVNSQQEEEEEEHVEELVGTVEEMDKKEKENHKKSGDLQEGNIRKEDVFHTGDENEEIQPKTVPEELSIKEQTQAESATNVLIQTTIDEIQHVSPTQSVEPKKKLFECETETHKEVNEVEQSIPATPKPPKSHARRGVYKRKPSESESMQVQNEENDRSEETILKVDEPIEIVAIDNTLSQNENIDDVFQVPDNISSKITPFKFDKTEETQFEEINSAEAMKTEEVPATPAKVRGKRETRKQKPSSNLLEDEVTKTEKHSESIAPTSRPKRVRTVSKSKEICKQNLEIVTPANEEEDGSQIRADILKESNEMETAGHTQLEAKTEEESTETQLLVTVDSVHPADSDNIKLPETDEVTEESINPLSEQVQALNANGTNDNEELQVEKVDLENKHSNDEVIILTDLDEEIEQEVPPTPLPTKGRGRRAGLKRKPSDSTKNVIDDTELKDLPSEPIQKETTFGIKSGVPKQTKGQRVASKSKELTVETKISVPEPVEVVSASEVDHSEARKDKKENNQLEAASLEAETDLSSETSNRKSSGSGTKSSVKQEESKLDPCDDPIQEEEIILENKSAGLAKTKERIDISLSEDINDHSKYVHQEVEIDKEEGTETEVEGVELKSAREINLSEATDLVESDKKQTPSTPIPTKTRGRRAARKGEPLESESKLALKEVEQKESDMLHAACVESIQKDATKEKNESVVPTKTRSRRAKGTKQDTKESLLEVDKQNKIEPETTVTKQSTDVEGTQVESSEKDPIATSVEKSEEKEVLATKARGRRLAQKPQPPESEKSSVKPEVRTETVSVEELPASKDEKKVKEIVEDDSRNQISPIQTKTRGRRAANKPEPAVGRKISRRKVAEKESEAVEDQLSETKESIDITGNEKADCIENKTDVGLETKSNDVNTKIIEIKATVDDKEDSEHLSSVQSEERVAEEIPELTSPTGPTVDYKSGAEKEVQATPVPARRRGRLASSVQQSVETINTPVRRGRRKKGDEVLVESKPTLEEAKELNESKRKQDVIKHEPEGTAEEELQTKSVQQSVETINTPVRRGRRRKVDEVASKNTFEEAKELNESKSKQAVIKHESEDTAEEELQTKSVQQSVETINTPMRRGRRRKIDEVAIASKNSYKDAKELNESRSKQAVIKHESDDTAEEELQTKSVTVTKGRGRKANVINDELQKSNIKVKETPNTPAPRRGRGRNAASKQESVESEKIVEPQKAIKRKADETTKKSEEELGTPEKCSKLESEIQTKATETAEKVSLKTRGRKLPLKSDSSEIASESAAPAGKVGRKKLIEASKTVVDSTTEETETEPEVVISEPMLESANQTRKRGRNKIPNKVTELEEIKNVETVNEEEGKNNSAPPKARGRRAELKLNEVVSIDISTPADLKKSQGKIEVSEAIIPASTPARSRRRRDAVERKIDEIKTHTPGFIKAEILSETSTKEDEDESPVLKQSRKRRQPVKRVETTPNISINEKDSEAESEVIAPRKRGRVGAIKSKPNESITPSRQRGRPRVDKNQATEEANEAKDEPSIDISREQDSKGAPEEKVSDLDTSGNAKEANKPTAKTSTKSHQESNDPLHSTEEASVAKRPARGRKAAVVPENDTKSAKTVTRRRANTKVTAEEKLVPSEDEIMETSIVTDEQTNKKPIRGKKTDSKSVAEADSEQGQSSSPATKKPTRGRKAAAVISANDADDEKPQKKSTRTAKPQELLTTDEEKPIPKRTNRRHLEVTKESDMEDTPTKRIRRKANILASGDFVH